LHFAPELRKVLLGSMVGSKEDVETVGAFFQDLRARVNWTPFVGPRVVEFKV
jgi:hypothetical protein